MSIGEALRKRVTDQAKNRCGYCLVSAEYVYAPMEIDHIIPTAKGGDDTEDNLWLACPRCNNYKSDQIEFSDAITQIIVPLFNPRSQNWQAHFECSQDDQAVIVGRTPIGRATVAHLKLNNDDNLQFRRLLVSINRYPPEIK